MLVPFEGSRSVVTGVCSSSPCCRPPPVKLTALSSVVSTVVSALLGCAVPIDASSFRTDRDGLSSDTGPRHRLKRRVHPRVSLVSPPEYVVSTSARFACAPRTPSLGFRSSSRRQSSESTHGEHPGSPQFRPQRFARSRRFAPRCTLQIYFTLLPRPGFPLRGSSPDLAAPPRRWPCPLAVGAVSLPPVARRRQATSRRPQDLVPGRDPQHRRGG
jgi:hypothetical protein